MPIRIVGRLVLDRVVDNLFAEIEQVAFRTQNIVPGIDFSNDPLLTLVRLSDLTLRSGRARVSPESLTYFLADAISGARHGRARDH